MTTDAALYYDETYAPHEVNFLCQVRSLELKLRHEMSTPAALTASQEALADRIRTAFAGVTVVPNTALFSSWQGERLHVQDEAQRATAPDQSTYQYAEDQLINCCQRNSISI